MILANIVRCTAQPGARASRSAQRVACRTGRTSCGESLIDASGWRDRRQFSHLARWIASNDGVGRNVCHHDGPRRDDAVVADRNARTDRRASADPYIVTDCDGAHCFGFRWRLREPKSRIVRMSRRIENVGFCGNEAIRSYGHALTDDDVAAMADYAPVTDFQPRRRRSQTGECECRLTVDPHVVANYDLSCAQHPVQKYARPEVASVARAISLEQRLADENTP